jgi:hypothetical protein
LTNHCDCKSVFQFDIVNLLISDSAAAIYYYFVLLQIKVVSTSPKSFTSGSPTRAPNFLYLLFRLQGSLHLPEVVYIWVSDGGWRCGCGCKVCKPRNVRTPGSLYHGRGRIWGEVTYAVYLASEWALRDIGRI